MKKQIVALLAFVAAAVCLQAQTLTDGTLYFLRGENEINATFAYERCHFNQKTEDAFVTEMCVANGENWKSVWAKSVKPQIEKTFISTFNDITFKDMNLAVGRYPKATYTMQVVLQRINSTGHVRGIITFVENRTGDVVAKMQFSTDGKGNKKDVVDGFMRSLTTGATASAKFVVKNSKRPAVVYE